MYMPHERFVECGFCGEEFLFHGVGRPQQYCAVLCRVKAHQARKRRAAAEAAAPLPLELMELDRWVRRSASKMPLRADTGRAASSTDASTWTDYAAAEASSRGVGLGFVLSEADDIVCIDLDDCVDDAGAVADWAKRILDSLPATFVELSPSGTGLHIWGRASVERGTRIRDGERKIEVYGTGRYIAIGTPLEGSPKRLAEIQHVIAEVAPHVQSSAPHREEPRMSGVPDPHSQRTAKRIAKAKANGAPDDLWGEGDTVTTPLLPDAAKYSDKTRKWYQMWCNSAVVRMFQPTDWNRLWMLAPLVDEYFKNPTGKDLTSIVNAEKSLGATVTDRLKLLSAAAAEVKSNQGSPATATVVEGETVDEAPAIEDRRAMIMGG